ncbi:hypothetical protein ASPWEDRAFT_481881 [Aspergillus wentii DTO 134E9]|uniref:Uncharacterized protein n=1 Tax=Aspergillus wentii DTO 134E9 TaxID=1073089 RepID=A0A1L9RJ64_ASPWE|nr:uncharacterized protein ASPWEDRAFT_481881 [Aspergillus wentii DTO 134E9]OJJ34887.1 hypothetical protein ASPWEDRAFT_481881 [Aspergillus wentii DTO 134E9]
MPPCLFGFHIILYNTSLDKGKGENVQGDGGSSIRQSNTKKKKKEEAEKKKKKKKESANELLEGQYSNYANATHIP